MNLQLDKCPVLTHSPSQSTVILKPVLGVIQGHGKDGWLGFNGILSTQVADISCLKKFKVC